MLLLMSDSPTPAPADPDALDTGIDVVAPDVVAGATPAEGMAEEGELDEAGNAVPPSEA